jgi:hypothetical protein
MKTWILCFNKRGASAYMRQDNQEKLSSLDLFCMIKLPECSHRRKFDFHFHNRLL